MDVCEEGAELLMTAQSDDVTRQYFEPHDTYRTACLHGTHTHEDAYNYTCYATDLFLLLQLIVIELKVENGRGHTNKWLVRTSVAMVEVVHPATAVSSTFTISTRDNSLSSSGHNKMVLTQSNIYNSTATTTNTTT